MTENDELLLLRALLRASDYGVLLSDSTRLDRLCNRRFCEMFGLESLETLNSQPDYVRTQLAPRLKDANGFIQTLETVYADPQRVLEDEVELIAPKPRLLRRYTAPVVDDNGMIMGRLWTFLDITRTRSMEDKVRAQATQLKEQSRQLASALKNVTGRLDKAENTLSLTQQQLFETEKLSAVGLLAASVAHDIRNLLTPLAIEVSLADQNDPDLRAESLSAMRRQIDGLALLTHRLLALARPDSIERAPTDLAELISHILRLVQPQAMLENVQIICTISPRLPSILADSVQMEQVLVNLILNAVQAMRPTGGGTLTLALDRNRNSARVRIGDTGPGITLKNRKRLFDPFFTTRPDGAGLGLFSCRRIAEAHGGTISVRSKPGQTQFTLRLPCLCPVD
ncbi:MAG: sensor histidine kinase [Janthinobacterium lividum]